MPTITQEELPEILRKHYNWFHGGIGSPDNVRANFADCDLSGLDLSGAFLRYAIFDRATLKSVKMIGYDLSYCTFVYADVTGSDLTESDLHSCNLTRASFRECNLSWACLSHSNFFGVDFYHARLFEAELKYINHFFDAVFTGTDMRGIRE